MSVDDVWGVETWRMNQSELGVEPGSTKDKKSMMGEKKEKGSRLTAGGSNLQLQVSHFTQLLKHNRFIQNLTTNGRTLTCNLQPPQQQQRLI